MAATPKQATSREKESGNILLLILLAVVLIGALTAALQSTSGSGNNNIDRETLILRAGEVKRYASELERAVLFILQNNGKSEADIRFAHPDASTDYGDLSADADPADQVFHKLGGAARYRTPPDSVNDGSAWEFYGQTALPDVGSDEADLIAVLPDVTSEFCDRINAEIGYAAQPTDTGTCLNGGASARFDDATQFASSPNTVDDTSFSVKPSTEGCVLCSADGTRHYYRVLLTR